jgi:hypothetical protein
MISALNELSEQMLLLRNLQYDSKARGPMIYRQRSTVDNIQVKQIILIADEYRLVGVLTFGVWA